MKTKVSLFLLIFSLCFNVVKAQDNLQNGSFEQWRLKEFAKCCGRNTDIPWFWGVAEQLTGLNYNKFDFREPDSSTAHSGSCCIRMFSDTTYLNNLVLVPGIIAYGELVDSASLDVTIGPVIKSKGMPVPAGGNPLWLNFFMKMDHGVADTASYIYLFTKWNSLTQTEDTLAYKQVDVPDAVENMNRWIEYTDTIHYTAPGLADTVRIIFYGGRFTDPNLQGNSTYLDDVTFYYQTTGMVSLNGQPVLQVFPNPASNLLTVKTGQYKPGNSFQIFDATGRCIKVVPVETETTAINISQFQSGNYFYRLTGKSNTMLNEGKFVVIK